MNDRTVLAEILTKVAEGELVLSISDQIFSASLDRESNKAIHILSHFLADEDLRDSDPVYDEHMRQKLLDCAAKLNSLRND